MSRDYFIHDAQGKRRVDEHAFPLRVGGKVHDGIVLPGVAADKLVALIALSDGHAYIQPAGDHDDLFHNNEHLVDSAWLKSGDRVQILENLLSWQVHGDKVMIDVRRQSEVPEPRPPSQPPPEAARQQKNDLPVAADDRTPGGHGLRRLLITFAVLLSLLFGFLMMSSSVTIRTVPEAAIVNMKGMLPVISLLESRLAFPGTYTLRTELKGYVPVEEEVSIPMSESIVLDYTLTEMPGVLLIKSKPSVPFQLYANGVEFESDDQGRVYLSRGKHVLRIETERYLPQQHEIEIEGFGRQQQLDIELAPAWGALALNSSPEGAEVLIDGSPVGQTPLQTELLQGRHEVRFEKTGYKPLVVQHVMQAGQEAALEGIVLQPVDGQLVLTSSPAQASVTVDGIYKGTTPLNIAVSANSEHVLRLSKAGFANAKRTVLLKPGQELALDVSLQPRYGTVFLTTRPAGTQLRIDGQVRSENQGKLRLATRPHNLEVSKPGYQTRKVTITPKEGASQAVTIELKRDAPKTMAGKPGTGSPATITTAAGQELRLLKPDGVLKMGASRREPGRRANESQRLVKLERPFYLASREVTNAEFRQYRPEHQSGSQDGAGLNADEQPVVNVSWDDAARYCNWLSSKDGLPSAYREVDKKMVAVSPMSIGYRLPSEAEWAWVARRQGHSNEQRYPWAGGYPPAVKQGNFADAQIADTLADVVPGYDDGFRGTAPVGSFSSWPAGFFDLGGNAAEWVHDFYAIYPGQATQQMLDPLGPESGEHHVVRGSSWRHGNITELRLSYRDYSKKQRYDLGFRIARYAH